MSVKVLDAVKPGLVLGDDVQKVFAIARENEFAIPAVNVVGTNTVNSVMEAAKVVNSPVIIQFSNGGAAFWSGKGLSNDNEQSAVAGGVMGALHVHHLAALYGVPVILHTDHAARKLLPWIEGLLDAGEKYFEQNGKPLYSSHMLDLSVEPLEENIETCKRYLERMSKMGMTLEIELGVTGGEEDGVDHSDVDSSKLYTQPEEVAYAFNELGKVSDRFTVAASFGNVHGVYKPGNVKLTPKILLNSQKYIQEKYNYWDGVRKYEKANRDYLQGQIGNPEGEDKPNKKKYDPRVWLREGEKSLVERLKLAFEDLNCIDRN
jgi:fructose-bisphosphate aldolase class II